MTDAGKELVRRHFEEIFNRQNLDVCDEIMANDYVEHAGLRPSASRLPAESTARGQRAPRRPGCWLNSQISI